MKKSVKLVSIICMLSLVFLNCFTVFAHDSYTFSQNDICNLDIDENYYISSITDGYEETVDLTSNLNEYSIDIDDVISKSVNVKNVGNNTYTGSYTSDKYNTGLSGYKYQIKFDWVSGVVSGHYCFSKISNYKIITYTNYLLLALTWESHSYTVTKASYNYNNNRNIATCYANYKFDVRDKTTHINQTMYMDNYQNVTIQSLM